jgi:hypothetical protein
MATLGHNIDPSLPPAIRFPLSGHSGYAPNVQVLGMRGCIKSPTLAERWPEHIFISRVNPHLTTRFYKIEIRSTQK